MRSAVFISSGIGNALMLVPLIKQLNQRGDQVTMICVSAYRASEIFNGFEEKLFNSKQTALSWRQKLSLIARNFNSFDVLYADYFSASRTNFILAALVSKRIITNHIPNGIPAWVKRKVTFITPEPNIHEGNQYLKYVGEYESSKLKDDQFRLTAKHARPASSFYITLQPSTGNNQAPYKTWPIANWKRVIEVILNVNSALQVVVLGDNSEINFAKDFEGLSNRVKVLIGETEVADLPTILAHSRLHIGGDSGIMHIAGCLGTPTVSIFGGSDPSTFGWERLNPEKHRVISHPLDCHPCNRWILPNRSRVKSPDLCPDFKCIRSITVEEVMEPIFAKMNHLYAE